MHCNTDEATKRHTHTHTHTCNQARQRCEEINVAVVVVVVVVVDVDDVRQVSHRPTGICKHVVDMIV